jgi:NAD(P)H-hydrate epimerase
MPARVVNADESLALDAAAIASGVPSRALMRAAAFNAATLVCARYKERIARGVTIFTGSGNNGGDGWALASALQSVGVPVRVREIGAAKTPDAIAERAIAQHLSDGSSPISDVIIDAMLGTGASGTIHGAILEAAREIRDARERGAIVVSLDLPTGVNGTTGAAGECVVADLTISFGTVKRGALISRAMCGEIAIVDIGLGASGDELPQLVDAEFVRANVPHIAPDSHKGTRKSVAIVAGAANMGGAAILAATGALRSGVGLVQVITAPSNIPSMHTRIPEALVAPMDKAWSTIEHWADAVLIGPGLATDDSTRAFVRDVMSKWRGPIVADAGALSAFDGDVDALRETLHGRPAIITPHPAELGRLIGRDVKYVLDNRFDVGLEVARKIGATVLLKGTPTVISNASGSRLVVASGTAALATGGSGDTLGGIVVTLLAQGCAPESAAACGAWIHGRAAELIPGIRGFRMTDVLDRLPGAWELSASRHDYPVITSLPALS